MDHSLELASLVEPFCPWELLADDHHTKRDEVHTCSDTPVPCHFGFSERIDIDAIQEPSPFNPKNVDGWFEWESVTEGTGVLPRKNSLLSIESVHWLQDFKVSLLDIRGTEG